MENHDAIHGKIHYFDWVIFNSYVSHHQRVIGLALGLAQNPRPWTRIIPSAWGAWQLEPLEPSSLGHGLKVGDLGRGPMDPGENCSEETARYKDEKPYGFPTKMIYRWWKMLAFPHVNLFGRVSYCFMTKSQFANWTITTIEAIGFSWQVIYFDGPSI